jgi:hypothetical protein
MIRRSIRTLTGGCGLFSAASISPVPDQGLMACDKGVFKGTPELSDISRPVMHHQTRHGLVADAPDRFAALRLSPLEEGVRKQGNVLGPISQRRQPDGNNVDPEEQIVPECSFIYNRFEMPVYEYRCAVCWNSSRMRFSINPKIMVWTYLTRSNPRKCVHSMNSIGG